MASLSKAGVLLLLTLNSYDSDLTVYTCVCVCVCVLGVCVGCSSLPIVTLVVLPPFPVRRRSLSPWQ